MCLHRTSWSCVVSMCRILHLLRDSETIGIAFAHGSMRISGLMADGITDLAPWSSQYFCVEETDSAL